MYQLISKYRGQIMGIASVMVVLLHFVVELYPDFHIPGVSAILGRGNIGVDIFLLVSGMGLWFSMSKNSDTKCFFQKRIHRVLLPSLAITLPYWLWFDLYLNKNGVLHFFLDWTGLSFWTHGITTIWYVSLIMLCYLFYPLIFRIQKKKCNMVIGIVVLLIVLFSVMSVIMPDMYERYEIALTRIPIFLIGSYLGEYIQNKQDTIKSNKLILNIYVIISVIAFMVGIAVNGKNHMLGVMLYRYGSGGIGILICFVICWIFEKFSLKRFSGLLQYLGMVSLELYLIHVMIRNIVSESSLGVIILTWQRIAVIISFILISFLVTWLVCCIKDRIEKKINQT